MISITGAAGKTGRAVIGALRARRAPLRALVQRDARLAAMVMAGASEAVIGDLTDSRSLEDALAGSSAVYHICPNTRPDEVEIGRRIIEACQGAGVGRLVYHSVLHPQIEAMSHHWNKLRVEELLIESGLSFTILQPAAYMQNLRAQWGSVVERGILEVPYALSTRLGMVDLGDVAEAAARALTEDGHDGAIYELCGPEVMDQKEIAAVLSRCTGRPVDAVEVSRDLWAQRAKAAGLPDSAISTLRAMFEHYERHGFWGNSRILEEILQRPVSSLATVVKRWLRRAE